MSVVFCAADACAEPRAEDGETQTRLLTAFDASSPDLDWRVVNDNVMGGRSSGGYRVADGRLHFYGSTNTEGGGFASIRTAAPVDLAEHGALRLKVRGDGREYTFRLEPKGSRISYWATFPTRANAWLEVEIPLVAFWPNWRGRRLERPPIAPSDVRGLGIMIYDDRDGPFSLQVDWIEAMPAKAGAVVVVDANP